MAENPDAMELQRRARRRLVGAIALVVFVVIVLPIVFDREPKPISQDLTIQIPSQDAGRFPSRPLPVAEPRPEAKAGPELKADAAKAAPESRADVGLAKAPPPAVAEKSDRVADAPKPPAAPRVEAAAKSPAPKADVGKADIAKVEVAKADASKAEPVKAEAVKTEAVKAAAPKVTADAPKGASGEAFVVPLGLFRNPDNVKKVRGWVTTAGYASFTEQAPESAVGGKAAAVKILAGPFPTRDAAEKAREKLKAKGVDVGPIAAR